MDDFHSRKTVFVRKWKLVKVDTVENGDKARYAQFAATRYDIFPPSNISAPKSILLDYPAAGKPRVLKKVHDSAASSLDL